MGEEIPPRFNSSRFREALIFAAQLHAEQTRKGSDLPYISHLLGVASIAMEYGADEDESIAALLHDAAEDQGNDGHTLRRICYLFGDRVGDIVESCSDTQEKPKPPWPERKARYISHLYKTTPSARLVSAADKLHNARSILMDFRREGKAVFDRFSVDEHHIFWYYRKLIEACKQREPESSLVQELERVVSELEQEATASADTEYLQKRDETKRVLDSMLNGQTYEQAN
jgi:(p)ppGpp synthase/HD superfamily hydrolase